MKNVKEFLKAINKIVKIPEIDGWIAASDLDAVEISDEAATTISDSVKGLLTEDAAKNNSGLKTYFKQQLSDSIKGKMLGVVDTQLHTITKDLFGEEALAKIQPLEFTAEKVKALHDIISEHQTLKADDKIKLQIRGLKDLLKKNEDIYNQKISDKDHEIQKINDGLSSKLTNAELLRRVSNEKLADKYNEDDMKSIITETTLKRINKDAVLKLDKNGGLLVFDPENPELKLYMDGAEMTADGLIKKHIGKYLAKSEPPKKITETKFVKKDSNNDDFFADPNISELAKGIIAQRKS